MDLEEFGPEGWQRILGKLERGEAPTLKELAVALRGSCPIPQEVREHIAGRLDGTIKAKGAKKGVSLETLIHRFWAWPRIKMEMKRISAEYPDETDAYNAAIEHISEQSGVPPDTLDKWVYPRGTTKK